MSDRHKPGKHKPGSHEPETDSPSGQGGQGDSTVASHRPGRHRPRRHAPSRQTPAPDGEVVPLAAASGVEASSHFEALIARRAAVTAALDVVDAPAGVATLRSTAEFSSELAASAGSGLLPVGRFSASAADFADGYQLQRDAGSALVAQVSLDAAPAARQTTAHQSSGTVELADTSGVAAIGYVSFSALVDASEDLLARQEARGARLEPVTPGALLAGTQEAEAGLTLAVELTESWLAARTAPAAVSSDVELAMIPDVDQEGTGIFRAEVELALATQAAQRALGNLAGTLDLGESVSAALDTLQSLLETADLSDLYFAAIPAPEVAFTVSIDPIARRATIEAPGRRITVSATSRRITITRN